MRFCARHQFPREIELYKSIEYQKILLLNSAQFNALDCYQLIDVDGKGYLDSVNVKGFLELHGYLACDSLASAIIRRLDKNEDAVIHLGEFIRFLLPVDGRLRKIYQKEMKIDPNVAASSSGWKSEKKMNTMTLSPKSLSFQSPQSKGLTAKLQFSSQSKQVAGAHTQKSGKVLQ